MPNLIHPPEMESADLLATYTERVRLAARMMLSAEQESNPSRKRIAFAMARNALKVLEPLQTELYRRLGVIIGDGLDRAAQTAYGVSRSGGACAGCGMRTRKGRGLHWWTEGGFPLPWVYLNHREKGSEKVVRNSIGLCQLFCTSCARHRFKARITTKLNPDLSFYTLSRFTKENQ